MATQSFGHLLIIGRYLCDRLLDAGNKAAPHQRNILAGSVRQ